MLLKEVAVREFAHCCQEGWWPSGVEREVVVGSLFRYVEVVMCGTYY